MGWAGGDPGRSGSFGPRHHDRQTTRQEVAHRAERGHADCVSASTGSRHAVLDATAAPLAGGAAATPADAREARGVRLNAPHGARRPRCRVSGAGRWWPARSAPPSSGTTSSSTARRPRWSSPRCSSPASPVRRRAGLVRHAVRGVRRPADRRCDLRPLRRPGRAQGDADHDADADGHRDVPHRLPARRRHHRDRRADPADPPARRPGAGRRRRVGRLGADVDGVGLRSTAAG